MSNRIVLFGGSGFIGSALRHGLVGDVVAPKRRDVDLTDRASLVRYLRSGDTVINAAGYASVSDRSAQGFARLRRDNVEAVGVLAEASLECGVRRLIHISSVAAMGQREGLRLTEDRLSPPRSPYGQSKRDAEVLLGSTADDLSTTILRPTSVFGEGRGLAAVLCRVADLPMAPLPAGGRTLVPFTYVGNVVEAVRLAISTDACRGRSFIVGDDDSYPLREIVMGLARGIGRRERLRMLPVPSVLLRFVGQLERRLRTALGSEPILDAVRVDTLTRSVSYSIEAFRSVTGYSPPYSLAVATERIGAWYRERRLA